MPVTFKDTGLSRIKADIGTLDGLALEVGVDPQAKYPDGRQVALIGLYLEFGTSKMKALPFMRTTLFANDSAIKRLWAEHISLVIAGRQTPVQALSKIGEAIARMTVDTILNSRAWARQLEPSTVARKGHSTPLQDTLKLSRSIGWAVRDRGGRIAARGKV